MAWNDMEHSIIVDLCVYRVVEVKGKVDVHCALAYTKVENASKCKLAAVFKLVDKIIDDATKELTWKRGKDALIKELKSRARDKVAAVCK